MNQTPQIAHLAGLYAQRPAVIPSETELAEWYRWLQKQYHPLRHITWFTTQELNPGAFHEHWQRHGRLLISLANNNHPIFSYTINGQFRAVHDWHHIVTGADHTFQGEYATFLHACETAPECIHWILFSEIVLQAAAFFRYGRFLPQKLVKI